MILAETTKLDLQCLAIELIRFCVPALSRQT